MSNISESLDPLYPKYLVGKDMQFIMDEKARRISNDPLQNLQPHEAFALVEMIHEKFIKGCIGCLILSGCILLYLLRNNKTMRNSIKSMTKKQIFSLLFLLLLFSYSFSANESYRLLPQIKKKSLKEDSNIEETNLNLYKFPGHYNRQTAHYGSMNI